MNQQVVQNKNLLLKNEELTKHSVRVNPDDEMQNKNAHCCLDAVFDLVLELDGTLSGEHGVGIEKRDFVDREIEPVTLALMKRIKENFDPKGILNPGKMFPQD